MRSLDADLLALLHEGMFDQPLWHRFLDRLRARTGAASAELLIQPADEGGVVEIRANEGLSRPNPRFLMQAYAANPRSYRGMRENRVYSPADLIDDGDLDQLALLETIERSGQLGTMRMVRVAEPGGVEAWLGCGGGKMTGPAVGALLTMLAPHLRIALRSFVALERERSRSSIASDAIDRLNFGWMTLDARGCIIDMTPHVEKLFQRSGVLRRGRYNRLTPTSPAIDREVQALLRRFATERGGRPRAINLSQDPWIDMLIAPIQDGPASLASTPVAVAYLSGDRFSQADRCEQLVELFGLLPSEARLAWAIAQGMSIAEAADSLGLTLETARNYSKKIYAKTGARGQPQLVRNILTSVLALA